MIYFYSGTPGSGKSLRVARDIKQKLLLRKQNVIGNMYINFKYLRTSHFKVKVNSMFNKLFKKNLFKTVYKKNIGNYYYISNDKMTVDFLYNYAKKFHVYGKEGQTLLVIDEAQMLYSPTVIKLKKQEYPHFRTDWLEFYTQHRRLGFNIILVSQFDRLIDPQIRCLFEYNHIHRKVNNFGAGWIFSLMRMSLFVSVHYWYGIRQKTGMEFFTYSKKYAEIFDSYEFQRSTLKDRKTSGKWKKSA